ncbi:MAG: endonuclease/exonuclease/phosphatase family protein [Marinosulfonomonas sp.]|nr:endonuclease/exonuclease/phosphatase family protein [Marinosulfonomonas sp.]
MLLAVTLQAEPIRIATYNTELERRGPGLLLRDILSGKDKQVLAVAGIITHISPDILLLNGFDYDYGNAALNAFADLLANQGTPYPHRFALRPNTGMATGLDMDGDGQTGGPRDAQGYGRFAGQGGMAILSRYPIDALRVQDFSALKWADFPQALLPQVDGKPFPSPQAQSEQRLSTTGHWVVPVTTPDGEINLLAFHATPPVFDGPEDRNGKRNHDEVRFWTAYLDGELDAKPLGAPFVILGDANLDPFDGDGQGQAIRGLLAHPMVQDTNPQSKGAVGAAMSQGGANTRHKGDPAQDTVDWKDLPGPGNMRVDYVLPSRDLEIAATGVFWPKADDAGAALLSVGAALASRHRLVWVDVILQR